MSSKNFKPATSALVVTFLIIAFVATLGILSAPSGATEVKENMSPPMEHEYPAVYFDGESKKLVGDKVAKEISVFFNTAENAIRTKDLDKLMSLYSDSYSNGPNDKEAIKRVWKWVFGRFDNLYTKHNMTFISASSAAPAMIIRCSGILMGTPKGENDAYSIALDHWVNNDHVLSNEHGQWKIIGTAGPEQQRFGFSKPIHPLF